MIFLGLTVLTEDPNRRDDPTHNVTRSKVRIDNITGPFTEFVQGQASRQVRPFSWFMGSRAAINEFRAFREACKGRLVPFWAPTWHHDLFITVAPNIGDPEIVVKNINYSRHMFDPLYTYRRYIVFIKIGPGVNFIRRIDGAVEDTTLTERLSLDTSIPFAMEPQEWMVSFLLMCRMNEDRVGMHWHSPTTAEAEFSTIDLPNEMPQVPTT